MKSKVSKKPVFVTFKRSQDKYMAAINVDDLKCATVYKGNKQVVDVTVSNHELTLDTTEAQVQRFERELSARYHIIMVGQSISTRKNNVAYNAVLKLDTADKVTYIWPRGLSMIRVADNELAVTVHGQEDAIVVQLDETPSATDVAEVFGLLNLV